MRRPRELVLHHMSVENLPIASPGGPVKLTVLQAMNRSVSHEQRMMSVVVGIQALAPEG